MKTEVSDQAATFSSNPRREALSSWGSGHQGGSQISAAYKRIFRASENDKQSGSEHYLLR